MVPPSWFILKIPRNGKDTSLPPVRYGRYALSMGPAILLNLSMWPKEAFWPSGTFSKTVKRGGRLPRPIPIPYAGPMKTSVILRSHGDLGPLRFGSAKHLIVAVRDRIPGRGFSFHQVKAAVRTYPNLRQFQHSDATYSRALRELAAEGYLEVLEPSGGPYATIYGVRAPMKAKESGRGKKTGPCSTADESL